MDITQLRLQDLKHLERLLIRKEELQKRVAEIDRELETIGGEQNRRRTTVNRAPGETTHGRRGALKSKIIEALESAGKEGLHIKDLASKLKVKEQNVRIWFYTTGKKISNIKKAGRAIYRWQS